MRIEFFDIYLNNTQIPNLMTILPLGSKLFHADGWMDGRSDMAKLIVAFRNFA